MVLETKKAEITAIFAAGAAALVLLAAGLSIAWFNRIV
jgi:Ca-activated chloride channel family protein